MGKSVAVLVLVALTLPAADSPAKIPPLSKQELERRADLIIEGLVVATKKEGKVARDSCFGWQAFVAVVIVEKALKGRAAGKIHVRYRTRVEDKKQCDGGATSYSLVVKQRYRLYLARARDRRRVHYRLISSSGVRRLP